MSHLELGVLMVGVGVALMALAWGIALLSPLGRRWWRAVRPTQRALLKQRAQLKRRIAALEEQQREAEALPLRLRRAWLDEQGKQTPIDALLEVEGVGDGTLDLLRRRGIKRLAQIESAKQLTHIKGIGQHKASLLFKNKRKAELAWEERQLKQYNAQVYPREHKDLVARAQALGAQAAASLTSYEALIKRQGALVGLWRLRSLPWFFRPVALTRQDALIDAYAERSACLGIGALPSFAATGQAPADRAKRLITRPLQAISAPKPPTELDERLIKRAGSKEAAAIHTLRESYEPFDFEDFIADLMRALGYTVHTTPRSGDHGADVIASKGAERLAIECKRYAATTSVGNDVVLRVAAHKADLRDPATQAWVVTTGRFTPKAKEAAEKFGVRLVGPDALGALMRQAGHWPRQR